ncbi:MAG: nitroreductase family protein [Acidobacteria bacterium]|nr:nitroreductase family protein [Acidobacteriota bacterium]MBU4307140.1 nitroreductase family protein [Acidobacteriota bacterium]MBU4405474.1 nitroreductase family protein [Acidobacteriota bacterium]MCG2812662.1 nitroreductase family protein [Candidatus Aminicenantes bacterium]
MELMKTIETRRAYRSLGPVEIDESLVRELATAASLSASCFNKQPWRYVFAFEKHVLNRLQGAMNKGNEWTKTASLIVAVSSRKDLDCVVKGREYYLFDTGMATAFLILRASELGLVAHPIAGFDEDKAKEILGIPADMRLITLVNVGKHLLPANSLLNEQQAEIEKARPERLPLSEIMRMNKF